MITQRLRQEQAKEAEARHIRAIPAPVLTKPYQVVPSSRELTGNYTVLWMIVLRYVCDDSQFYLWFDFLCISLATSLCVRHVMLSFNSYSSITVLNLTLLASTNLKHACDILNIYQDNFYYLLNVLQLNTFYAWHLLCVTFLHFLYSSFKHLPCYRIPRV